MLWFLRKQIFSTFYILLWCVVSVEIVTRLDKKTISCLDLKKGHLVFQKTKEQSHLCRMPYMIHNPESPE